MAPNSIGEKRGWRRASGSGRPGFLRSRRGATALEFALVAPILMSVLLGMAQLALAIISLYHMHDAVSDAGRRIAIGELEPAAAESFILRRLGGHAPPKDGKPANADDAGGSGTSGGHTYTVRAVTSADTLDLSVSLAFAEIDFLDLLGLFEGERLSVSTSVPLSSS